jgi:hypothetical protein
MGELRVAQKKRKRYFLVHVHVALVQYVRDELVSNPYIVIHVLCLFVVVSLVPRFRCSTFMFVVRLQLTIVQTKIDQTSNFHHRREEAANDTRRNQIYRAIWGRQQEVQRGLNRVGIRRFIQIKKDIVEFRYPEEGATLVALVARKWGRVRTLLHTVQRLLYVMYASFKEEFIKRKGTCV